MLQIVWRLGQGQRLLVEYVESCVEGKALSRILSELKMELRVGKFGSIVIRADFGTIQRFASQTRWRNQRADGIGQNG